jgi:hypothetical protein
MIVTFTTYFFGVAEWKYELLFLRKINNDTLRLWHSVPRFAPKGHADANAMA